MILVVLPQVAMKKEALQTRDYGSVDGNYCKHSFRDCCRWHFYFATATDDGCPTPFLCPAGGGDTAIVVVIINLNIITNTIIIGIRVIMISILEAVAYLWGQEHPALAAAAVALVGVVAVG